MLVVFWLVNLYSLFVYIEHNGDEPPKDPSRLEHSLSFLLLDTATAMPCYGKTVTSELQALKLLNIHNFKCMEVD